jgi:hypothetical protein
MQRINADKDYFNNLKEPPLPLLEKEGIFLPFSRGDARGVQ